MGWWNYAGIASSANNYRSLPAEEKYILANDQTLRNVPEELNDLKKLMGPHILELANKNDNKSCLSSCFKFFKSNYDIYHKLISVTKALGTRYVGGAKFIRDLLTKSFTQLINKPNNELMLILLALYGTAKKLHNVKINQIDSHVAQNIDKYPSDHSIEAYFKPRIAKLLNEHFQHENNQQWVEENLSDLVCKFQLG